MTPRSGDEPYDVHYCQEHDSEKFGQVVVAQNYQPDGPWDWFTCPVCDPACGDERCEC